MRSFPSMPTGSICPVCGSNEDKECVLLGIDGTQSGRNIEAQPYHLECIDLIQSENGGFTYLHQRFERKDGLSG